MPSTSATAFAIIAGHGRPFAHALEVERIQRRRGIRAGHVDRRHGVGARDGVLHQELGFDQIWLTEHHVIDYGLAVDPASLAAAAASRTRRVRIGLAAAILPFHHPLRLAEQMALIDIISKGRLDVGVGRGNRPAEFKGYHVPQQENRERFDETIDVILKAWTEERFTHEGRFYTSPRPA